ncbi:hypothetical protein ULMS_27920 [Patiriisocius marinistellae]|uniref:Rhodanese domain-containing protein n=1 Tax=Patiriisocius marinistellae TaxID=2494560 RepID=A0A5J4G130_9FLAO|nr:rhodanese-like domain-containing protein [Patiriisocius marinistellae]GEQ87284.1 hypothetical protein ULMS_27920 [Patiriisocius marinistellae]
MKSFLKLIIALFLCVGIISCNNKNASKNADGNTVQGGKIVKVLAPQAMHDVLKDNPNAQLVDVRTTDEFKVSHLKDAQNICVTDNDFKEKAENLDRNKPVYVYCKRGGRSARAAKILQEMGFKEIYDLDGGITKWEGEDFDVEQ